MKFTSPEAQDVINSHFFPFMLIFSNIAMLAGWSSIERGGVSVFEIIMVSTDLHITIASAWSRMLFEVLRRNRLICTTCSES